MHEDEIAEIDFYLMAMQILDEAAE